MKRLAFLLPILLFAAAHCHAQGLTAVFKYTTPGAAATVTANASGGQTTGPIVTSVYRAPATITNGIATCGPFSTSTYVFIGTSVSTTAAASGASYSDPNGTIGSTYCYGFSDNFQQAGSTASAVVLFTTPITFILPGVASSPTGITVSLIPTPAS
jgi:hypothetical protein